MNVTRLDLLKSETKSIIRDVINVLELQLRTEGIKKELNLVWKEIDSINKKIADQNKFSIARFFIENLIGIGLGFLTSTASKLILNSLKDRFGSGSASIKSVGIILQNKNKIRNDTKNNVVSIKPKVISRGDNGMFGEITFNVKSYQVEGYQKNIITLTNILDQAINNGDSVTGSHKELFGELVKSVVDVPIGNIKTTFEKHIFSNPTNERFPGNLNIYQIFSGKVQSFYQLLIDIIHLQLAVMQIKVDTYQNEQDVSMIHDYFATIYDSTTGVRSKIMDEISGLVDAYENFVLFTGMKVSESYWYKNPKVAANFNRPPYHKILDLSTVMTRMGARKAAVVVARINAKYAARALPKVSDLFRSDIEIITLYLMVVEVIQDKQNGRGTNFLAILEDHDRRPYSKSDTKPDWTEVHLIEKLPEKKLKFFKPSKTNKVVIALVEPLESIAKLAKKKSYESSRAEKKYELLKVETKSGTYFLRKTKIR